MNSETLNEKIRKISDLADNFTVKGLEGCGKTIPYIGWYWRYVNFDNRISLGDCGDFIGFMENNKWGYPEWDTTEEQSQTIKEMLEDLVENPTQDKFQEFFDYVQTCSKVITDQTCPVCLEDDETVKTREDFNVVCCDSCYEDILLEHNIEEEEIYESRK